MNRPLMITGLFAGTMGLAATAQAQSQAQAQAQDCDAILVLHDVRSAGVLAQADRFILENGYGCDAETVAGDTVPTTTSMVEKGEPDVSSDTHAGTPMRVTTGGIPHIPGASVYDKMKWLEEKDDGLRKLLLRQPRGYPAHCCNILVPPSYPEAQAGYIIMEHDRISGDVGRQNHLGRNGAAGNGHPADAGTRDRTGAGGAAGLAAPDLDAMRRHHRERPSPHVADRGRGADLLRFDRGNRIGPAAATGTSRRTRSCCTARARVAARPIRTMAALA